MVALGCPLRVSRVTLAVRTLQRKRQGFLEPVSQNEQLLETLAREAGLSRSTFAATFKAVTGDTPLDYLTRWRMYRAKVLLRGSELSLMEIAGRVGYETDTALSRAFRRFEGIAPGEWRRSGRPTRSATERRAQRPRRTTLTGVMRQRKAG